VDVKEKKKEKRGKKRKYSESECVVCIFYEYILYDKIAKIKEEFNILICSRSRIINLYVSCISNIRWKDKILKLF
jgi:hypothetical protein